MEDFIKIILGDTKFCSFHVICSLFKSLEIAEGGYFDIGLQQLVQCLVLAMPYLFCDFPRWPLPHGWRVTNTKIASNVSVNCSILVKTIIISAWQHHLLLWKESIDIIDNIKMHDVLSKVKLASEKLKGLPIFNDSHLESFRSETMCHTRQYDDVFHVSVTW